MTTSKINKIDLCHMRHMTTNYKSHIPGSPKGAPCSGGNFANLLTPEPLGSQFTSKIYKPGCVDGWFVTD